MGLGKPEKTEEGKSISSGVAVFLAISVAAKALGLLRDRQQAVHFGASTAESIAIAQAVAVPSNMLAIMFSAALSASFIPVFVTRMEQDGKEAAYGFAALFLFLGTAFTALLTAFGILFAEPIFRMSVGAGPIPHGTVELGASLLRLMFPVMVLSGVALTFAGILQALGEFRITAALSVASNGIILAYYFFFLERFGVRGLAVCFLISFAAQGLIQLPYLARHGFGFRAVFRRKPALRGDGLRQMGLLALPALASSWIVPANLLVNARAAAHLYGGQYGLNAVHYAHNLYAIASGVYIIAVANVVFPKLARQGANADSDGFAATLLATFRAVVFALVPLTVIMAALGRQIVGFIYGGGLFGERAVEITATALAFYAPGIVGYGLMVILARACFALHDGKTPLLSALAAISVNGVLSFALAPGMEVAGPALANAAGSSVGAALLVAALARKSVMPFSGALLLDALKMLAAGAAAYAAVALAGMRVQGPALGLFLPAAAGGLAYFACALAMGLDEAKWLKHRLMWRIGKR